MRADDSTIRARLRPGGMSRRLGSAEAVWDGTELRVSTGCVERVWRWGEGGLRTVGLSGGSVDLAWFSECPCPSCDWILPGVPEDVCARARLTGLAMEESGDEGFTSPHLCVRADLEYAVPALRVRFEVWAYPDAPGLRTQLCVKAQYVGQHVPWSPSQGGRCRGKCTPGDREPGGSGHRFPAD